MEMLIKVVVLDDLITWQKLNITAFLMGGIGNLNETCGDVYQDKSGKEYLPIIKQPVVIYKANQEEIKKTFDKANARDDFKVAIYTRELFDTYSDVDNRAAVARVETDDLDIVGLAIYGPKNPLNKCFKNISLHD